MADPLTDMPSTVSRRARRPAPAAPLTLASMTRAPPRPVPPRGRGDPRDDQPQPAAPHGPLDRRHARARSCAAAAAPVAVDLGYGAAPWTAVELLQRLRTADPALRGRRRRDRPGPGRGGEAVRAGRADLPARRLRGPAAAARPTAHPGGERAAPVRRGRGRRRLGAAVRAGSRPAGCWSRAPATRSGGGTSGWRWARKGRGP